VCRARAAPLPRGEGIRRASRGARRPRKGAWRAPSGRGRREGLRGVRDTIRRRLLRLSRRTSSSCSAKGRGDPSRSRAYWKRHAASPTSESRNIDCSSAYATEVGARSCEKSGDGILMLAKCAACPASCMRVVRAVCPDPTALGSASEVKCLREQVPRISAQAPHGAGVGERRGVRHGRLEGAVGLDPSWLGPVAEPVAVLALAVEQVEPHARPLVRDAQRGEGAAPLLDGALEGEVRVELLRDRARHHVRRVVRQQRRLALGGGEVGARLLHQRAGALLERVEHPEEGALAEPLRLRHLVVVKVLVAELARHRVAGADELDEAVRRHELANRAQPLPAGLARRLAPVDAHLRAQAHGRQLDEGAVEHRAEPHLVARVLERALDRGALLAQGERSLGLHDVAAEGALKDGEGGPLRLGEVGAGEVPPRLRQLLLGGEEGLHLALGLRQSVDCIRAVFECHLCAPKLLLERPVKTLVLVVHVFNEGRGRRRSRHTNALSRDYCGERAAALGKC